MLSIIVIVGAVSLNLSAHDFFGEIPEDVPTFRIKFLRDHSEVFGAIRIQGEWVRDTSPIDLQTKALEIVIDIPWEHPQPQRRELGQRVDISYEVPALRKKRLEEGWKKSGFIVVDTPNGRKTIHSKDYRNAINVIKKAHEIYSSTKEPTLYYSPTGKEISFKTQGTNFIKLWGIHILTLLIGGSSLIFITWFFFIRSE